MVRYSLTRQWRDLLDQLTHERFILYLTEPFPSLPDLEHFTCQLIDPTTLEVEIHADQTLNDLFTILNLPPD